MKADYVSFRRATNASLVGLAIQFVLSLALWLTGYYTGDPTQTDAAIFGFIGVFVWLGLAILFDQHRRERVEAMEAETLSESGAASSSVFESAGDEMRVQARRLRVMVKFGLPALSLVLGLLLIGFGVLRIRGAQDWSAEMLTNPPEGSPATLFTGLVVAFVGFIFARYASGMSKQDIWAPLRGGAGFAVGLSLFGTYTAIAQFVRIAEPDVLLRWQPVLFSGALIFIGAEIILNLLVDLYRPRKKGDPIRPGFDSRLMAFVAAPDRVAESVSDAINYQFGFDVASTWFYRLISKWLGLMAVFGVIIIWALSCITIIGPDQEGLQLRNGKLVRTLSPGAHLTLPWPWDQVVVPRSAREGLLDEVTYSSSTTGVMRLELGTPPPDPGLGPILWTEDHTAQERFAIVRSSDTGRSAAGQAADRALIAVEVPMVYAVSDVEAFERLGPPLVRENLLRAVGQREVMLFLSEKTVDEVLSSSRSQMAEDFRVRLTAAYERLNPGPDGVPLGAGIEVLMVGVEGVHPPKDTAEAFENVVNAQQNYEGRLELARTRAVQALTSVVGGTELSETIGTEIDELTRLRRSGADEVEVVRQEQRVQALILDAGGEAAEAILQAGAQRWSRHMGARSASDLYGGLIASYSANPLLFEASQRVNAWLSAMEDARVYIVTSDDIKTRIELQDRDTAVDVFDAGSDFE
ncbi:MAG: SPFH domain-containing protein [Planctomycetota bacterium]